MPSSTLYRVHRSSGPVVTSKGRAASARMRASTSATGTSRATPGSIDPTADTICDGTPSGPVRNTVRSDSCRATRAFRARPKAAASNGPRTAKAAGTW